jgi:diguanylate cyclase (GGDEF)-like protein
MSDADIALARRSGTPFTLAYLDLDNFKAVNDQHGHHAGDRALTKTAAILREHSRASDLVARLGGDEFALFLSDTGRDSAERSLERLRGMVESAMAEQGWPITASVGAITYLNAPATLDAAVHAADAMMYRAKQRGKNRVHVETVSESEGESPKPHLGHSDPTP